jgi:phage regulator Rha-like protein
MIKESVINTSTFTKIKVKTLCKKKIFDKYKDLSIIIVLDNNGKVVVYEDKHKNTFTNLREVVGLFGSEFFKNSLLETDEGKEIKEFYENRTGLKVRDIYKDKL